jgi:hypothetical protein
LKKLHCTAARCCAELEKRRNLRCRLAASRLNKDALQAPTLRRTEVFSPSLAEFLHRLRSAIEHRNKGELMDDKTQVPNTSNRRIEGDGITVLPGNRLTRRSARALAAWITRR